MIQIQAEQSNPRVELATDLVYYFNSLKKEKREIK